MSEFVHASDCAAHNAPAYPPGPCNCGARALALIGSIRSDVPDDVLGHNPMDDLAESVCELIGVINSNRSARAAESPAQTDAATMREAAAMKGNDNDAG